MRKLLGTKFEHQLRLYVNEVFKLRGSINVTKNVQLKSVLHLDDTFLECFCQGNTRRSPYFKSCREGRCKDEGGR